MFVPVIVFYCIQLIDSKNFTSCKVGNKR